MTNIDLKIFFSAAYNGDIFILKKCLDDGIDIHACNDLALRLASKSKHQIAIDFLLARGANIQAIYDAELRQAALEGDIETVSKIFKQFSCSEIAKIYAMYNAIFGRHENIVEFLLKNGVSPTANNGAILNVVKLCNDDKVNKWFENYLN